MRARLSAISNFTTSLLLTVLQNWTANNPEILINEQLLTVTSVYFLSNDSTPVVISTSPTQTPSIETNTKHKMILFSAIGSAGGLSLFLCVCCIILSVCILRKCIPKRNYILKRRYVVHIISNKEVITIYTDGMKSKKEKIRIKINVIWQQKQNLTMSCTVHMIRMIFLQTGNQ